MPTTILVTPIGDIGASIITQVRQAITHTLGFATSSAPLLEDIDFAYHFSRNQYHSTAILQALEQAASEQTFKVVAITDVDLFIPILTHVFGEAQMGGRACILSTYRLSDDIMTEENVEATFAQRLGKEALHELGHTFNLKHCPDENCLMHYCRRLEHVDHKSHLFCRYCRILLDEEIQRLTGQNKGP